MAHKVIICNKPYDMGCYDMGLYECFENHKFNWKKSKKATKGKWLGVMFLRVHTLIKMVLQKFMIHLQVFSFIRILESGNLSGNLASLKLTPQKP